MPFPPASLHWPRKPRRTLNLLSTAPKRTSSRSWRSSRQSTMLTASLRNSRSFSFIASARHHAMACVFVDCTPPATALKLSPAASLESTLRNSRAGGAEPVKLPVGPCAWPKKALTAAACSLVSACRASCFGCNSARQAVKLANKNMGSFTPPLTAEHALQPRPHLPSAAMPARHHVVLTCTAAAGER